MSVAIMWLGVFAVLQDMPIVSSITNKIRDYGNSLAGMVATLPYKAPVLPLGQAGQPMSIKEALGPLDMRGKIAEFTGEKGSTDADTRKFYAKASTENLAKHLQALQKSTGDARVKAAESVAKAYNFDSLEHMMRMNQETLQTGFRKSEGYQSGSSQDKDLYNLLAEANKQKSASAVASAEKRQADLTERAVERGERAAQESAAPAAPPTGAPAGSPGAGGGNPGKQ